jgi:hypothetical protein
VIISLGTIAGSFAHILKSIFSYKHFAYQHEPHSEFMLDFGIWNKASFSYLLLNYFEKRTAKAAEIISTGTDVMVDRLRKEGASGEIFKLPSCANDTLFNIDNSVRNRMRDHLGLSDADQVFIYVGKFGGIYYKEEIFDVIGELNSSIANFFIIILSPNDLNWIKRSLNKQNVMKYHVATVPFEKVHEYLNASDMGISAIPGFPSQKFRSPIKVGEYLLCGLPYITNEGVSEDDIIAKRYNVGVVLNDFSKSQVKEQMDRVSVLVKSADKNTLREIGLNYRALSTHENILNDIFSIL